MIKKIICPTDFSNTANNAIEYASNVARVLGAELQILSFVQVNKPAKSWGGSDPEELKAKLESICAEVHKKFGISATATFGATVEGITHQIAAAGRGEENLLIMGTNGVDSLGQFFFGTNTFKVIKKSKIPVWIVPEGVKWFLPKKVLVAWDNHEKPMDLPLLTDILGNPDLSAVFLHVAKSRSKKYSYQNEQPSPDILNMVQGIKDIKFEAVIADNIITGLYKGLKRKKANLLVVLNQNRSFFSRYFRASVTRELVERADYPVLVLNGG